MTKLDHRTIANIEVALEKACRVFPIGGDHESRKYIAQKLKLSAKKGNVTLGALDTIAHSAVQELLKAKLGLAAMSESNGLIGLAILSCTDALEALDNALASADLESAHEFIEQAKGHLLTIRTRSARHIFTDDQLDSFEPKDFSNAINARERAPQVCPFDRKPKKNAAALARRSENGLSLLQGNFSGTVFASTVQFCTFLTKLGHLGALRRRKLGGLHSRVNGLHVAFVFAWLRATRPFRLCSHRT